jgi:hypothetical protein
MKRKMMSKKKTKEEVEIEEKLLIMEYNDQSEEISYIMSATDSKATLTYSGSSNWTKPGELSSSLVNTGDGFIFKDHSLDKTIEIDYSQMENLQILLKLLKEKVKYKIYKEE